MSDLKPCPFCGSDKITVEWEPCEPLCAGDTNRRWFAECTQCSCQGPFCQKEPEVALKWNNQSRLTAAEKERDELKREKDTITASWKQVVEIGVTQKEKIHALKDRITADAQVNQTLSHVLREKEQRITAFENALREAKEALEEDAMWAFENQPTTMKCEYPTGGDLTMGPNNCKAFFAKRKKALQTLSALNGERGKE